MFGILCSLSDLILDSFPTRIPILLPSVWIPSLHIPLISDLYFHCSSSLPSHIPFPVHTDVVLITSVLYMYRCIMLYIYIPPPTPLLISTVPAHDLHTPLLITFFSSTIHKHNFSNLSLFPLYQLMILVSPPSHKHTHTLPQHTDTVLILRAIFTDQK